MNQLLFVTPVHLPHSLSSSRHRQASCTATLDTPSKSLSSTRKAVQLRKSRFYSTLPADLPLSKRPPPPPVHKSVPYIGFFLELFLGRLWKGKFLALYGDIYTSNFFIRNTAYISNYDAIVDILSDTDVFRSKGALSSFSLIFGDIMIVLDPPHHTIARRIVAPAFSQSLLPVYFGGVRARVSTGWERVLHSQQQSGNLRLDSIFRELYLSIVVEITTGVDLDSTLMSDIQAKFLTLQRSFVSPPFGPVWSNGQKAKRSLVAILQGVIQSNLDNKAALIEKLRGYGDKIAYLGRKDIGSGGVDVLLISMARSDIKTGAGVKNDPEVINQLCNLMLGLWWAGHATAAATSASAFFHLGWRHTVLEQLAAEQYELVLAAGGDRQVTYTQVNSQMPLLGSYIMEVLRMHPAVSGLNRKLSTDIEIFGHFLKKDTPIFVDFAAAMRDERFFPDPNTLKVDRFLKKEEERAFKVLTFGGPGSPHHCIGETLAMLLMKTTFAELLRNYKFTLDPKQIRDFAVLPEDTPKSKVLLKTFVRR